jgi:hypothetical protein
MAKKTFEVALLLTAKDEATRIIAAAAAAQQKALKMSQIGDKAFGIGAKTGLAGAAILAPMTSFINAAEESEVAGKRLNNVFKTMGEVNGKAAEEAAKFADKLQYKIGIEDEEIMMVQSKIATFKAVSDETARMSGIFDRATQAAFDLAAGGFGEASQNAVMLGKALQNPALGAAALSKAGTLNKADIPLIKQIQATYGLGAAQKYVMGLIEKQVKGQAANIATDTQKMKIRLAAVQETLGNKLLPSFVKLTQKVSEIADKFSNWADKNPELLGTIVSLVTNIGLLLVSVSAISFAVGGVFKIISAGMAVMNAYRAMMVTVTAVQTAMAFSALSGATAMQTLQVALKTANLAFLTSPIFWIVAAIAVSVFLIIKYWEPIKKFFANLWTGVKVIFWKAIDFIKEWGLLFLGPIGWVIKAYQLLPDKFKNIGSDILMGLWNGIKSKAMALFDFVKGIGKGIANAFKNVLGIASPSKVFMDYGVNITEGAHNGIKKGQDRVIGASKNMGGSIKPTASRGGGGGGNSTVSVTFAPVINGGSGDVAGQVKALIPELIRQIEAQMQRKARLAY